MSVSLHKIASIPASQSAGATVFLPSGIRVRISAVTPLPARSAHAPRVRLVGRTRHGGDIITAVPAGSGLRPAERI
jgi:hypothetical protein